MCEKAEKASLSGKPSLLFYSLTVWNSSVMRKMPSGCSILLGIRKTVFEK